MEGTYAGRHASRQRGQSVEFADYRQYTPGDEPNHVDWKAYGRSDRLFVKLFEHQSHMSVHILLDASASMGFDGIEKAGRGGAARGGGNRDEAVRKYDHAARLAGAVAFLTLSQQDRVSLSFAQSGLAHHIPSRSRMPELRRMLDEMESRRETPRGRANLANAIDAVHRLAPRRGVLAVISDLLDATEPIVKALNRWTAWGGEAIVFQTLHRDELHLPDELDEAIFTDSETGRRVRLRVSDLRDDYHQRQRQRIDAWHTALRGRGIDHNLVSTATPYDEALQRYLFRRAAASS